MRKKKLSKQNHPNKYIALVSWYSKVMLVIVILAFVLMIPLLFFCSSRITSLWENNYLTKIEITERKISDAADNISEMLSMYGKEIEFMRLGYISDDQISELDYATRVKLINRLHEIIFTHPLINDCILLRSEEIAVTNNTIFLNGQNKLYPDYIQVDSLTFAQWQQLINDNSGKFIPAGWIRTLEKKYQGLTYVVPFLNKAKLIAIFDVQKIKDVLLDQNQKEQCLIEIMNEQGDILYSERPDDLGQYYTISQQSMDHKIKTTVFVSKNLQYEELGTIYLLGISYIGLAIIAFVLIVYLLSSRVSEPLIRVLSVINGTEKGDNKSIASTRSVLKLKNYVRKGLNGAGIEIVESELRQHLERLNNQKFTLIKAHLKEIVLGAPRTEEIVSKIYEIIPTFPQAFRFVVLRIYEINDQHDYSDVIGLLGRTMAVLLPNSFFVLLNGVEIALFVDACEYPASKQILDFIIENVNKTEPAFRINGFTTFEDETLFTVNAAYRKLSLLSGVHFQNDDTKLCECNHSGPVENKGYASLTMTLYSAITSGRENAAIQILDRYALDLVSGNKPIFELFASVLKCIKVEYTLELMNIEIPEFGKTQDAYVAFKDTIHYFFNILHPRSENKISSFVDEVLEYLDAHFREIDLDYNMIANHFQCSTSKLRKEFKSHMGITVSDYIEHKRMKYANDLLINSKKSVNEIALESGFSSANTFYKAHQRVYGLPPSALQEK